MVQTTLHYNGTTIDTLQMAVTPGCPQIVLRSLMLGTLSETDNWQAMSLAILDPQTTRNDITDSFQYKYFAIFSPELNALQHVFLYQCL